MSVGKTNTMGIIVWSGKTARILLRKGYTIIDVKPAKEDVNKSLFVFKEEDGIRELLTQLKND